MVAEALGDTVAPVPFVEVVAAARSLARGGDAAAADAVGPGPSSSPPCARAPDAAETTSPSVRASSGDLPTLDGTKRLVSGAVTASSYLVSARTDGDVGLFVVDADAVGDGGRLGDHVGVRSCAPSTSTRTPARRIEPRRRPRCAGRLLLHELRILRCAQLAGIAAGRAAPGGRPLQGTPAVRRADRHLPGGGPPHGRRLARRQPDAGHRPPGGLAHRPPPAGHPGRGQRGGVGG